MRIVAVIPARYGSSRFPGKPLADICGKPMIWHVYQNCLEVPEFDEVYVATDDIRIAEVCDDFGMKCLMTSEDNETGTDRVVEVSDKVDADLFVVVMGDEPLILPGDIGRIVDAAETSDGIAFMLVTKFRSPVDVVNNTTIKIALNDEDEVIFMSRQAIPYPKALLGFDYYKNMGAYAFRKEALEIYRTTPKGRIERAEDLEMLRLIEKHCVVRAVEVSSDSMSVDTPKDLERIRDHVRSILSDLGTDEKDGFLTADSWRDYIRSRNGGGGDGNPTLISSPDPFVLSEAAA